MLKQPIVNEKKSFDFESNIQNIRQKADQRRNIIWNIKNDTLYRDATNASGQIYTSEDYAVQILSILRAAKVICTIHHKNAEVFNTMAHNFMKKYNNDIAYSCNTEDIWYNEVININNIVLNQLKTLFPKQKRSELNKDLRLAENYAGLDDTHFNIITTFKIQDQCFQLEDRKCSTLTKQQLAHFNNRESESWYKHLSSIEKKLFDHYIDKILDGQHCIPTQIRQLPGCRNTYQKTITAISQNDQHKVLGQYAHLGTIYSFNKALSKQLTKENWDQLCQNNNNKGLNMMIFNHSFKIKPVYAGEQDLVMQTQSVVQNNHFMCFPINIMGSYSTPEFKTTTKTLLNQINTYFHKDYSNICNIVTNKQPCSKEDLEQLDNHIQHIKDKSTQLFFQRTKALKIATDLSKIENIGKQNFNSENYYAQLASDYIFCQTTLDQLKNNSKINLAISCKSGKDRTGYVSFLSDGKLIEYYLNGKVKLDNIYNAIASSAHIQLLASLNGGMPGRLGIKKHVIKHKNVTDFSDNRLYYRAALLTKIAD